MATPTFPATSSFSTTQIASLASADVIDDIRSGWIFPIPTALLNDSDVVPLDLDDTDQ